MAIIHMTWQSDLFQRVDQVTKSGVFAIVEWFKFQNILHDCVRDDSSVTVYRVQILPCCVVIWPDSFNQFQWLPLKTRAEKRDCVPLTVSWFNGVFKIGSSSHLHRTSAFSAFPFKNFHFHWDGVIIFGEVSMLLCPLGCVPDIPLWLRDSPMP